MRTPLLAGNWKMYKTIGETTEFVRSLLAELGPLTDREAAICAPFTSLQALRDTAQGGSLRWGAQDVYYETQGAYTGEIAPQMLTDLGCTYAIVGHSERRQYFNEDDSIVNRKARAAQAAGLTPILCVGESKPQRTAGQAESVVATQIRAGLHEIDAAAVTKLVIAYEPIWAIGTGETATPQDAQQMHAMIRGLLGELYGEDTAAQVRILYGGSVKPDNVDELMSQPDIDGALVGGASLKSDSFLRIIRFQA